MTVRPLLRLAPEMIKEEQQNLPELPWEKELRYTTELGLSEADALVLTADPELAQYFEAALVVSKETKLTANWVMTEVMRLIKEGDHHPEHLKVTATSLGELVAMISKGDISSAIGKQVFEIMAKKGGSPAEVVDAHNLKPIGDEESLGKTADEIIEENPGPLKQYLEGKESTLQFFVGQMMRKTKGRADPVTARELLKTKLEEKRS
ncbi:MAG: hypothetical protein HKN21_13595 [Candidatus Eisenbacteria bacterium]|uniref:Asn/Gln amidotransferase domain-containing protein n=1 Tax=Eiseniibacteriota bacterium TaxID=2212470 RepID=A0A7Y2H3F8_UNCEI|nr:hypothetical protein [Candidatus Eisenbacteria bacterium]